MAASTPAGASERYPLPVVERDEPGLQAPFSCLEGEGPQYIGRTQDGAVLVLTNYRLYHSTVSIPVLLIDTADVKDIFFLHISCKDARYLKLCFLSGEMCSEWARRLSSAIATPLQLDSLFAFAYAAWSPSLPPPDNPDPMQDYYREFERLGLQGNGMWRVSGANMEYRLCPSYPQLLVVPASVSDETLEAVARFRSARRIPAIVWRHRGNGAVIARSSQPEVGWLGWRSEHDERMLAALVAACNHNHDISNGTPTTNGLTIKKSNGTQQDTIMEMNGDVDAVNLKRLLIVDARSYASAVTNRARGGGCECTQYYTTSDIQFMSLPNIHYVRRSFHSLRSLTTDPDQTGWYGLLEKSLWLQGVGSLLRGACQVARAVLAGRPVLVHCSDGWDRTPQLTATAQLLLDPAYRTIQGFRTLVEREWLDFGHKFADRCGHAVGSDDPNERCPVFIQWLDCVQQIMKQYPCTFEFNDAFLVKLARHAHACLTGTFLFNTGRERRASHLSQRTACAWALLKGPQYRNPLYAMQESPLMPEYSMRALHLWTSLYVGSVGSHSSRNGEEAMVTTVVPSTPPPTAPPSPSPPHNDRDATGERADNSHTPPTSQLRNHTEGLSKARSCENLSELDEEGEGTGHVQRRSSDSRLSHNNHKTAALMLSGMDLSKSSNNQSPISPDGDLMDSYFGGDLREDLSEHFSMEDSSPDRPKVPNATKGMINQNGYAKGFTNTQSVNGFKDNRASTDSVDGAETLKADSVSPSHSKFLTNGSALQRVSKLSMNLANSKLHQDACVIYRNGSTVALGDNRTVSESPVMSPNHEHLHHSPIRPLPDTGSDEPNNFVDCIFSEALSPSDTVESILAPRRAGNSGISCRSVSESSQQTDSSGGCVDLAAEAAGWLVASPPQASCPLSVNRRRLDSVHNGSLNDAAATLLEAELGKLLSAEANGNCIEGGEDTTLCPNTPQHGSIRVPRRNHRSLTQRNTSGVCSNTNPSLNGTSWYDMSVERMVREECPCGSCSVCGECCCCGPGDKQTLNYKNGTDTTSPQRCRKPHHCRSSARVPCVCALGPDGSLDGVVDPVDGLSCPHSPIQARLHQIILEHKMREEALSRELRAARAALVRRGASVPPNVGFLGSRTSTTSPSTTASKPGLHHNSHTHTPQVGDDDGMSVSRCIADALMTDDHFPSFIDHFTVSDDPTEHREECKRLESSVSAPGLELWNSCAESMLGPKCQRCDTELWHGKRKHYCRRCGGTFCGECSQRWRGSGATGGGVSSGTCPPHSSGDDDLSPFDSPRVCLDCYHSMQTKPNSCCLYVEESSRTALRPLQDSSPQPS